MAKSTIDIKVKLKWWAKPVLFLCVIFKRPAPSCAFDVEVVK